MSIELAITAERMHELAEKGQATIFNFGNAKDYLATIGSWSYVHRPNEGCYQLLNHEQNFGGKEK